jgi:hypothetical protein
MVDESCGIHERFVDVGPVTDLRERPRFVFRDTRSFDFTPAYGTCDRRQR